MLADVLLLSLKEFVASFSLGRMAGATMGVSALGSAANQGWRSKPRAATSGLGPECNGIVIKVVIFVTRKANVFWKLRCVHLDPSLIR